MHMSTFPDADRGMLRGNALVFCDPRSPWQRGTRESTNGPPMLACPLTPIHAPMPSLGTKSRPDQANRAKEGNESFRAPTHAN